MSGTLELLVVGGAAIDYTVRADVLPTPAKPVIGDVFLRDIGGKGFNQAVAASRLGRPARFVACIGDDAAGDDVLRALDEDAVPRGDIIRVRAIPTARTIIAVD